MGNESRTRYNRSRPHTLWKKNCPVKALTSKALASVYFSKGGPVIAITNRQPNQTMIKVKLDLKKLGLPQSGTLTVYDARRKTRFTIKNGILITTVGGRNYTLVKIKNQKTIESCKINNL